MIIDQLLKMATGAMKGLMAALPQWQTSFDTSKVDELITTCQVWDNWLPLHEACICIGIAVGLWSAMQGLAATLKTVETLKP